MESKVRQALALRDASLCKVEPAIDPGPKESSSRPVDLPSALLSPEEIELTERSIEDLLHLLATRACTVEKVIRAFLRRAAVAQQATNCLTELMWDEAIERARYLDALPEPKGALYGLPISTKEMQGMRGEGKTCHSSYVSWIDNVSPPIPLHDLLWDAGCVFYARTTQPQTVMHLETHSNIYGRTTNPFDDTHTSGGSSGGEGALVAMKGSIMGIGGDIGGSIRIPAAFNGVYGFKPTSTRIPLGNAKAHMPGKETVLGAPGPICRSRSAIELFMKVVLDSEPWKTMPSVFPQRWTPYTFDRPLKVAVQWTDGIVTPHPPVLRALRDVASACKSAGMTVVDWDSLEHEKAWQIVSGLYFPDGGEEVMGLLEEAGEPILPLTDFIINQQPNVKKLSQAELWKLCAERDAYRNAYARHWSETGRDTEQEVDVILAPCFAGAAPPHDCSRYWGYTATWNLLDYPALVFPVTAVFDEDRKDPAYVPANAQDRYNYELYDHEKYIGLPVNLQLIARRNFDEKLLAALELIEASIAQHGKH